MCKQVHVYVRVRESVLGVKAWQQAPLPLGHLTDSKNLLTYKQVPPFTQLHQHGD